MSIDIRVPIKTSSTNDKLRGTWHTKTAASRRERGAVLLMLRSAGVRRLSPTERAAVLLERISRGKLDDDNLRGALKAVRDEVAAQLGVDDGDARVLYEYAQSKGHSPLVRIVIKGARLEDLL